MSQPVGDLVIDLSLDAVRFDEQMSRVRRHFSGLDTDARKTATVVEPGSPRWRWRQVRWCTPGTREIPRFQRLIKPWFFPVISPD